MRFFEGCTALITGASSGLGEEFARQLAPWAEKLILVARRRERLERIGNELEIAHPGLQCLPYQTDLADEQQRLALGAWLDREGHQVDFLVNNAGLGDHGPFETAEWARIRAMLEVNIAALTHLARLLAPAMAARGRGAILNVSSIAGFFPLPNMAVYAATKAYVTSLTEALAMELRPRGIIVSALCPGPVPTEFFAVAERGSPPRTPHYESFPMFVVSPSEAVRAGLEAVARQRVRVVPGFWPALAVGLALLVPFFVTRAALRAFRKKI